MASRRLYLASRQLLDETQRPGTGVPDRIQHGTDANCRQLQAGRATTGQLRCWRQVRTVRDPSSALTAHRRRRTSQTRCLLARTIVCCGFEVRQTVQGEGLAGDGWEQHMMTHGGPALRLLIRSLRLPSCHAAVGAQQCSQPASSALEPRS